MNYLERIQNLINMTGDVLNSCIGIDRSGCKELIDPIDNEIIRNHYADTHFSVGFLLNSMQNDRKEDEIIANTLIFNILSRIDDDSRLKGYHNDFNLFALCIAYDLLINKDKALALQIEKKVLSIPDSNHNTTNWLPMRIFVNEHRYTWTGNKKYIDLCRKLTAEIQNVTYKDGYIDDRAPKGVSFNMQYDIATLAVLVFVAQRYEIEYNFESALGAIINLVLRDGDINYLGRGCNQVFGWSMWIYLLSATGQETELNQALSFLEKKLPKMLENKNIFLNDYPGEEKYLWWDYHYSSVYIAHLYLWLVLAISDYQKFSIKPIFASSTDSGVRIIRDKKFELVCFDGRKEYLAERGPMLAALWSHKYGMIWKGGFGPWQGAFGKHHAEVGVVLRNYMGLIQVKKNKDYSTNRILRKLNINLINKPSETLQPLFAEIDIRIAGDEVIIIYTANSSALKILNIPVLEESTITINNIEVNADGNKMIIRRIGTVEAQYGTIILYQTNISSAREWSVTIK